MVILINNAGQKILRFYRLVLQVLRKISKFVSDFPVSSASDFPVAAFDHVPLSYLSANLTFNTVNYGGKIRDLLFQILEQEEDVIIKQGAQSRESRLMASRRNGQCLQCQLDGMDNANQEKHLMHHLATAFIIVTPYLGQFWSWQPHSPNSCRPVYDKHEF